MQELEKESIEVRREEERLVGSSVEYKLYLKSGLKNPAGRQVKS